MRWILEILDDTKYLVPSEVLYCSMLSSCRIVNIKSRGTYTESLMGIRRLGTFIGSPTLVHSGVSAEKRNVKCKLGSCRGLWHRAINQGIHQVHHLGDPRIGGGVFLNERIQG